MSRLALGLDLGSSGLRLALAEAVPGGQVRLLSEESAAYPRPFADPRGWQEGLIQLVARLDPALRCRVEAIAIDGTSGTLLCCRPDGGLQEGEAGLALPYHLSCPEWAQQAGRLCADPSSPAASASGSLARALRLLAAAADARPQSDPGAAGEPEPEPGSPPAGPADQRSPAGPGPRAVEPLAARPASPDQAWGSGQASDGPAAQPAGAGRSPLSGQAAPAVLLRHQADWLMGWLLGDWRWGEEGNNLRLGWDPEQGRWSGAIDLQPWAAALPRIRPSGAVLGCLDREVARRLDLPEHCQVVAGSTDANAAVLAADPQEGDGITVLGTTLVLKQVVAAPIRASGVSSHRVAGRWLVGGASNAGAGILRRFFTDGQIAELSRQIDPQRPSGLDLLPLPRRGERFPVDDPDLEPRLEPRPTSDALYLQALLEGLTQLERQGWQRLRELGAPPLRRVITLGGGARNPQWAALRRRALGVPVLLRPGLSSAQGMARLALRSTGRMGAR